MPAIIRKRKAKTTTTRSVASAVSRTGGIDAFTKVSKASKATTTAKAIIEKEERLHSIAITVTDDTTTYALPTNKKRRLDEVDVEEGAVQPSADVNNNKRLKRLPLPAPRTPRKPIIAQQLSSLDTPTKTTRTLLENFRLNSTTPTRTPVSFHSSSSNLLASTPEKPLFHATNQEHNDEPLPAELLDLINLHASFLTALSIHYAHNGTHSPADLRNLCPDVARSWGKRSVTLLDIRRTLGIQDSGVGEENGDDRRVSHFYLSDYGHGKICVEIKLGSGRAGRIARPVDEDLMNGLFVQGLRTLWGEREEGILIKQWMETLPLGPITVCESVLKVSPLLAKGQRRLEDLKKGIVLKEEKIQVVETHSSTGKKLTLLERLRAKSIHNSTLPPPPSAAERARKAALGRIPEVVSILTILSTSSSLGQQRISFTLPTIIGKLKDSFKTPISKGEADLCVRLLVELAPEWVRIVKMGRGKMEAVVVDREGRVEEGVLGERIRSARA